MAMTTVDSWPVEISLEEEDGQTRAEARLAKDGVGMIGRGLARRNPDDQEVTQIGEEIAAARTCLCKRCTEHGRGCAGVRSRGTTWRSRTRPAATHSCPQVQPVALRRAL